MREEIFDIVNDCDEVTGQLGRSEVHRLGLMHRAVHVLVFNRTGQLFLQKRSRRKDTWPGAWDSSASGHVDTGEEYDECAVRELREEIGLQTIEPPRRMFKIDACDATGQEFCWVYRLESEGPFHLDPLEVERGEWYEPAQITSLIHEQPTNFASAFVLIWQLMQERKRV